MFFTTVDLTFVFFQQKVGAFLGGDRDVGLLTRLCLLTSVCLTEKKNGLFASMAFFVDWFCGFFSIIQAIQRKVVIILGGVVFLDVLMFNLCFMEKNCSPGMLCCVWSSASTLLLISLLCSSHQNPMCALLIHWFTCRRFTTCQDFSTFFFFLNALFYLVFVFQNPSKPRQGSYFSIGYLKHVISISFLGFTFTYLLLFLVFYVKPPSPRKTTQRYYFSTCYLYTTYIHFISLFTFTHMLSYYFSLSIWKKQNKTENRTNSWRRRRKNHLLRVRLYLRPGLHGNKRGPKNHRGGRRANRDRDGGRNKRTICGKRGDARNV